MQPEPYYSPCLLLPQSNWRPVLVTVESVTNEDALLHNGGAPSLSSHILCTNSPPVSFESEQWDSVHGDPAAQPPSRDSGRGATHCGTVRSATPPVSTSRTSHSLQWEVCDRTERAEARANTAYEQNCTALELISKSMESVKDVFAEAKRAQDKFNELLSTSSRACKSIW